MANELKWISILPGRRPIDHSGYILFWTFCIIGILAIPPIPLLVAIIGGLFIGGSMVAIAKDRDSRPSKPMSIPESWYKLQEFRKIVSDIDDVEDLEVASRFQDICNRHQADCSTILRALEIVDEFRPKLADELARVYLNWLERQGIIFDYSERVSRKR